MKKTNEKRYVVFVSLTGDQQIKCYDLDLNSGTLELRSTSNAHGPAGALYLHPSEKVMLIAHVESVKATVKKNRIHDKFKLSVLSDLIRKDVSSEAEPNLVLCLVRLVDSSIGTPTTKLPL